MSNKPYTYLVKHKPSNTVYYGVRYAADCHPSDLFVTYFTSSNRVKLLLEQDGIESFSYEVRRVFDSNEAAQQWEEKVLRRMDVTNNPQFINFAQNRLPTGDGENNNFYGKKHTKESKEQMSDSHKKRLAKNPRTAEQQAASSAKSSKFSGKKHTKESKAQIGESSSKSVQSYWDSMSAEERRAEVKRRGGFGRLSE